MNVLILSNMAQLYISKSYEDITEYLEKYNFNPYSKYEDILAVLSKFNSNILIQYPNFNKYPEEFYFEFGKALVYLLNQSNYSACVSYNLGTIFLGVRVAVKDLCSKTNNKLYTRIEVLFNNESNETSKIYINEHAKLYQSDSGKVLTFLPRGFHDIWQYSMAKLF